MRCFPQPPARDDHRPVLGVASKKPAVEASLHRSRQAASWRPGVAKSKTWMFCARVRAGRAWMACAACRASTRAPGALRRAGPRSGPDRAKSDPRSPGRGVQSEAGVASPTIGRATYLPRQPPKWRNRARIRRRRHNVPMSDSPVSALTIAGSDSGGGAGIQADLKAFAAHGVHGLSAIAALTAQPTRGVTAVHVPPVEFLRAQIDACFDDFDIGAVKLGMLATAEVIHTVADALQAHAPRQLVLDPVMVATSGARLLAEDALEALRTR